MTTTAVEKASRTEIQRLIEDNKVKIGQLLPDHVDVTRFVKSALLAVSRNPFLATCTPKSIFTAVLNAAELGLDFTPAKGHAYLVPYKNEASFMPGYRGMIDLARRSGVVRRIESVIVHRNDTFDLIKGLNPNLIHKPVIDGDAGEMIGAYAIAWFNDGETQYEYMTKRQIDDIRKRAKTDIVWKSDYEEMARKTVVRRLFKYLPCSPDVEKALEYDSEATGLKSVDTDTNISRTSQLADLVSDMGGEEAEFTDIPDSTGKQSSFLDAEPEPVEA